MTTIVGKDAALEDTLNRFKRIAQELQLDLVEEQWLNPLPDLWSGGSTLYRISGLCT